jgi:hypothetical protein
MDGGALAAVRRLTFDQDFCILSSMEAVIQNELFPVIEASPKSKLRQFMEAIDRHGPMIPRAHIPIVLDISKQRVHQLIEEGRIATVEVQGREFIPLVALEVYLADERKNGRPVSELSIAQSYRKNMAALWQERKNRKKTS